MSQHYSDPSREDDLHSLPDVEVFELTAEEVAVMDDDNVWEAGKHFPLMHMNSREREKAVAWMIEQYGISGGWFYWFCFPGCLPDGDPIGPYATRKEAIAASQEQE